MFTSVLMIEQPLTPVDVDFVTTLHGDDPVSFVVLMRPRGDQDRLLRAIDDVALGELPEALHERDEPEGEAARGPAEQALEHPWPPCARRAPRPSGRSSSSIPSTDSRPSSRRRAPTK